MTFVNFGTLESAHSDYPGGRERSGSENDHLRAFKGIVAGGSLSIGLWYGIIELARALTG